MYIYILNLSYISFPSISLLICFWFRCHLQVVKLLCCFSARVVCAFHIQGFWVVLHFVQDVFSCAYMLKTTPAFYLRIAFEKISLFTTKCSVRKRFEIGLYMYMYL